MKKIEINVLNGNNKIMKKFHIEQRAYKTADGQARMGIYFELETPTNGMASGISKGFIDGATIYNEQGKPYGSFTRPPSELAARDKFQVNFSAGGVFECVCTSVEEVAPPPVNTPAPPKPPPRGVKTRAEIEWEMEQMKNIPLP